MNLGTIWSNKPTIPPIQSNNVRIINKSTPDVNKVATRSFWGASVWFFFHTISCRIEPIFYAKNHLYVWNFIKKICHTLPCPHCQKHASEYVNKIPHHQINTKEKLKSVLFNFHNSVNQRTGKQVVGLDVLKKYNRANIKQIFDLFESRFFHSYIGRRQFDDWIKAEVRGKYYEFYNIIRTKFI